MQPSLRLSVIRSGGTASKGTKRPGKYLTRRGIRGGASERLASSLHRLRARRSRPAGCISCRPRRRRWANFKVGRLASRARGLRSLSEAAAFDISASDWKILASSSRNAKNSGLSATFVSERELEKKASNRRK